MRDQRKTRPADRAAAVDVESISFKVFLPLFIEIHVEIFDSPDLAALLAVAGERRSFVLVFEFPARKNLL